MVTTSGTSKQVRNMMKRDSKYTPLFDFLENCEEDQVTLTLTQIEEMMGAQLPPSAWNQRGWWSNRSRGALQSFSWMEAGYLVETIDLDNEVIIFRKPIRSYKIERDEDIVLWNGELVKALRYHLGMSQSQLAKELGVRQQTISDWETGSYLPRRVMSKYLTIVAERVGFTYGDEYDDEEDDF
jgi:DNA-binding transcriptional regulator YiaG